MKKFLSFLLTFVMLFSLAMPAMAAEVTGSTNGDVSATFDPGAIEFTGITFSSNYPHRYDEETNTYTIIITPDRIGKNVSWDLNFIGTNLDLIDESNELLMVAKNSIVEGVVPNEIMVSQCIDYGYYHAGMNSAYEGYSRTDFYSNDGGVTWVSVCAEVKQSYYVTVSESENGTVTAVEYALPNDIVALNVSPAHGYELETLTVMNGETPVEVANNAFTMPAGEVTVSATFKEATPQKITVGTPENGSVTADLNEATVGTTVTLTVSPSDDCRLVELTVNDGAVEVTKVDDTTYTFVMPNAEVSVNATFEKIPHTVTIEDSENGTVSADKPTATKDETVTLTWTAAEGYELVSITVTDADGEEVAVDQGLTTCTFTMPASDVTVKAVFDVIRVVSADIVWGSLAYSYTDEGGWQNQSSAADAGTVTVTNTGNTPFNTKATYSAEMNYMNIRGTFDHGETLLAVGENQSFKLTLHNRPTRVLNGQKIGTVTVHISKTEFEDFVTVSNEQELLNALADGGAIKFANDITVSSINVVEATSNVSIDLNGFTFDGIRFDIPENTTLNISNGTVGIRLDNYGGELIVSNCTINTKGIYAPKNDSATGTTTVSNTTVNGELLIRSGIVVLYADVTLTDSKALAAEIDGTIICHFDPSAYLGNGAKATDNGDGTWTVTKK